MTHQTVHSFSPIALVIVATAVILQTSMFFYASENPFLTFVAFVAFAASEGAVLCFFEEEDGPDSPFELITIVLACIALVALGWIGKECHPEQDEYTMGAVAFLVGQLIATLTSRSPSFELKGDRWPRALLRLVAIGCYGIGIYILFHD